MSAIVKHPRGHEYAAPPPNPPPPEGAVTLFDRLGGRAGISRLIKWFYARVRFEPELEPIFNAHVEKWSEHLEMLIDYWCGAAGGPSNYQGALGKHARIGIRREHFDVWLRVWGENCRDLLQPREAAEMIALASRIAEDLQDRIARAEEA